MEFKSYQNSVFFFFFSLITGCAPNFSQDVDSAVYGAQMSLSSMDCAGALAEVQPVYNSVLTNNSIRMQTAAAYACYANLNMFTLIQDLVAYESKIKSGGLFQFFAKEFPSVATPIDDKIPQAAFSAMDSVMSALNPGILMLPSYTINSGSYNPGSILYSDRISDANSLMTFIAMAAIGALENRYGAPDSNYNRTSALPWTTGAAVTSDGCAFSAALLNLYDSLAAIESIAPANVAAVYGEIHSFLDTGINGAGLDEACALGCSIICAGSVSCSSCPMTLRNRGSCVSSGPDINACAAAGLTTAINVAWATSS